MRRNRAENVAVPTAPWGREHQRPGTAAAVVVLSGASRDEAAPVFVRDIGGGSPDSFDHAQPDH